MESTLSLTLTDLQAEVGFFLGFGRGAAKGDTAWTTQQQASIDSCVQSGLRAFYYPPPEQGSDSSYDWSFMRPVGTLNLAVGAQAIPLPDDFGGIEGEISVRQGNSSSFWPIRLTNEGMIRQRYSETPSATGRPLIAALSVFKQTTPVQGQRQQLLLFPASDAAYTLQVAYYFHPDYLTAALPYPLGGMGHAETIKASCLAVAELQLDDAPGPRNAYWMQRLLASISLDRRNKEEFFGSMNERRGRFGRRDPHGDSLITFNGVQY